MKCRSRPNRLYTYQLKTCGTTQNPDGALSLISLIMNISEISYVKTLYFNEYLQVNEVKGSGG